MRDHLPYPEAISNAPSLQIGLGLYFQAFWDLSTSRQIGLAVGPIPWIDVWNYGVAMELSGEQMWDLVYHMREMDAAYLEWRASKDAQR